MVCGFDMYAFWLRKSREGYAPAIERGEVRLRFVSGLFGDHFIRTRGCVSCQCMAREVTDFKRVKKWMTPRKSVPDAARFLGEAERGNWRCSRRKCVGNGGNGEVASGQRDPALRGYGVMTSLRPCRSWHCQVSSMSASGTSSVSIRSWPLAARVITC